MAASAVPLMPCGGRMLPASGKVVKVFGPDLLFGLTPGRRQVDAPTASADASYGRPMFRGRPNDACQRNGSSQGAVAGLSSG